MSVTSEFLLKGYALALEQCGLLLRDAVLLYENKSYASARVMATFAWEELGRSQILLDFWRTRVSGSPVTLGEINAACKVHLKKQQAGMLSLTMRPEPDSEISKILAARTAHAHDPQSQGWREADAKLKEIDAMLIESTPKDRHEERMTALYVEPKSGTEWNRPADRSAKEVYEFLVDAVNDYRGRYNTRYIPVPGSTQLLDVDPELYRALEAMTDRPTLPDPVSPSWPD